MLLSATPAPRDGAPSDLQDEFPFVDHGPDQGPEGAMRTLRVE
jgi:hypothetical protein